MAVSVDNVYRTVLSVLNKDTGGSISVDEFNKFSIQAQMSIMEDYFYEFNAALNDRKRYLSNSGYGDVAATIREKLDELNVEGNITFAAGIATLPTNEYRILSISSQDRLTRYEEVSKDELTYLLASPLSSPHASFPIFYRYDNGTKIRVYPSTTALNAATVTVDYIEKPSDPRWGYMEDGTNGAYLYDSNPYIATGLVIKENAFEGSITTNISNGVDDTYSVTATISTGGTIDLSVTVTGNTVSSIEVVDAGSGFIEGTTLTVGTTLTPNATDITVTGVSSDLVITLDESDIYSGSTAGSTNFALHPSEEPRLVREILSLCGLTLRDADVVAAMGQINQGELLRKQDV